MTAEARVGTADRLRLLAIELTSDCEVTVKGWPALFREAADEIERLRTFAADCAEMAGGMVNGNRLAERAKALLKPNAQVKAAPRSGVGP